MTGRRPSPRDLIFGGIAAALVITYAGVGVQLARALAPRAPEVLAPNERRDVPVLPGAIAFVMQGYAYVLRDGRYATLTSDGRTSEPHLPPTETRSTSSGVTAFRRR